MLIVDTSVWVDHLGRHDPLLFDLLNEGEVLGHPFVAAELALGSLADRGATLQLLENLPQARVATHFELLGLIDREQLAASGVGFVDAHLLASARLTRASLWTRDKRLGVQAQRLGCAWGGTAL